VLLPLHAGGIGGIFYFALSVPKVFIPKLDVILRLEKESTVLVGSILGGYLFSLFLSPGFYLLLEGDKENMNIKVSVHYGFDRFREGK